MESSFTFLRVRGIPIGANWSWLFVFALVTWTLGGGLFPRTYPGLEPAAYVAMALATSILFFASILLHELGHAFRALREGMHIEGITLWFLGGVAKFTGMFPSAGAEFRIAIAGPIVSVVLALAFTGAAIAGRELGWPLALRGVLDYLGRINGTVVAFNLVPALPLDGGRVLRAWLWHRQGSFAAATHSAAKAGRAFGFVLIGVGLLGTFTGADTGGLWLVFLGWFLLQASQAEVAFVAVQDAFGGLLVADVMTPAPVVVPADASVAGLVELATRVRHSTYPVVQDGRLAGIVSIRQAAGVPWDERDRVPVAAVMMPADEVPVLQPHDTVVAALARLQPVGRGVVVVDERPVGILSMSDVARTIELRKGLPAPAPARARPAGIGVWIIVALAMATAAAALYHPPLAVISPGSALDVSRDAVIEGVPVTAVNGRFLLTSVRLSQPSALSGAIAAIRPDQDVVSLGSVIPAGVDPKGFERQQRELFDESRRLAAAAAARTAGMTVTVDGAGARVVAVLKGAPASRAVKVGDVIVAVDDKPVRLASNLGEAVRARPAATRFRLEVRRNGATSIVEVQSARLGPAPEGAVGIGVFVRTQDFKVGLPFEVRFRGRDVVGPSAGLAYALAIADQLDAADVARGRTIAATGTIDYDGSVGEVGGVREKALAAKRAGADVFIVPSTELGSARSGELPVVGVESLGDAIDSLLANARGSA